MFIRDTAHKNVSTWFIKIFPSPHTFQACLFSSDWFASSRLGVFNYAWTQEVIRVNEDDDPVENVTVWAYQYP